MAERYRDMSDTGKLPPYLWTPLGGTRWPGARMARRILRAECPLQVAGFNEAIEKDNNRIFKHNLGMYTQCIDLGGASEIMLDMFAHRQNGQVPVIGEVSELDSRIDEEPDHALIRLSIFLEYEAQDSLCEIGETIAAADVVLSSVHSISSDPPISDRAKANVLRPLGDFITNI